MGRNRKSEQLYTVTKLFDANDIDLSLASAGRTLYQSLAKAKERTRTNVYYTEKGIKFMFNPKDRKALLEVIQGDNDFWQAWVKQNETFDSTGFDKNRPTIHRINPDGNYEFGNIGVLPRGEHQQEHAKPVVVFDLDNLTIDTYKSQSQLTQLEGVKPYKISAMNKVFCEDKLFLQQKEKVRNELTDRNRKFFEKSGIEYRPI